MNFDLSEMSLKDLKKLASDVEKAIVAAEAKALREARKAAEMAAQEYGFSLSELADPSKLGAGKSGAKGKKGLPKYANPDDPSQTWTGKGRQPAWFKAALESGRPADDMLI